MLPIIIYAIQRYVAIFISVYAFLSVIDAIVRYCFDFKLYADVHGIMPLVKGSLIGGISLTAFMLISGRVEVSTIVIIATLIANGMGIFTGELLHRHFTFYNFVRSKND